MQTVRDYELNRFETAIFVWSQSGPAAKEAFNNAFISKIFSELGFEGDELDMRTQLFMGYLTWEYTDFCPQSKAKQNRPLNLRLLTEK